MISNRAILELSLVINLGKSVGFSHNFPHFATPLLITRDHRCQITDKIHTIYMKVKRDIVDFSVQSGYSARSSSGGKIRARRIARQRQRKRE